MSPARRPGPRPGPRPETRPSGTRPSGLGRSPRTVPGSVSPDLRDAILAWYPTRGRDLAFRGTTDPYAILVSEAMAQQTQAARAADYWSRFMHEFPTVHALAAASPAAVLRAWRGLGYNRRAIAIRDAAVAIVRDHGGRVPDDIAALERLPGVGPYTARAVAALAFGRRVGAMDVNVRRVLGRVVSGSAQGVPARDMQVLADGLVPKDRPGTWTHALMDVGATFCRSREPRCAACPARPWCRCAQRDGAGETELRSGHRARRVGERPAPFASTSRWLRGRLLDLARDAAGDGWTAIPAKVGEHSRIDVEIALEALSRDGLIERDQSNPMRVRLPVR